MDAPQSEQMVAALLVDSLPVERVVVLLIPPEPVEAVVDQATLEVEVDQAPPRQAVEEEVVVDQVSPLWVPRALPIQQEMPPHPATLVIQVVVMQEVAVVAERLMQTELMARMDLF